MGTLFPELDLADRPRSRGTRAVCVQALSLTWPPIETAFLSAGERDSQSSTNRATSSLPLATIPRLSISPCPVNSSLPPFPYSPLFFASPLTALTTRSSPLSGITQLDSRVNWKFNIIFPIQRDFSFLSDSFVFHIVELRELRLARPGSPLLEAHPLPRASEVA